MTERTPRNSERIWITRDTTDEICAGTCNYVHFKLMGGGRSEKRQIDLYGEQTIDVKRDRGVFSPLKRITQAVGPLLQRFSSFTVFFCLFSSGLREVPGSAIYPTGHWRVVGRTNPGAGVGGV